MNQAPYDEMMAAALTLQTARVNALRTMQEDNLFWGVRAHQNNTSSKFYRGITFGGGSAITHLAGLFTPALADHIAGGLRTQAMRWRDEMTADTPECPRCDDTPGCHHAEELFHDGGKAGVGCDRVFRHRPAEPETRPAVSTTGDADSYMAAATARKQRLIDQINGRNCTCFDEPLAAAREILTVGADVTRRASTQTDQASVGPHAHLVRKEVRAQTTTGGTITGVLGASTWHGLWIGGPDDGAYLPHSQIEYVTRRDGDA